MYIMISMLALNALAMARAPAWSLTKKSYEVFLTDGLPKVYLELEISIFYLSKHLLMAYLTFCSTSVLSLIFLHELNCHDNIQLLQWHGNGCSLISLNSLEAISSQGVGANNYTATYNIVRPPSLFSRPIRTLWALHSSEAILGYR